MNNTDKLSKQLDIYVDRSRKTIQHWMQSYINAEYRIVNGTEQIPTKKGLQEVYEYAMLDNHLSAIIEQRKSKVAGEQFAIYTDNEVNEDKTTLLNKQWFSNFTDAVLDSRFYGYNLVEVQELKDSEINSIKIINRGNVIPEVKAVLPNPYNSTQLIYLDNRPDSQYYYLIDGNKGLGILNKIVPITIMKRITLSYWTEHSETFGTPMTVLKTTNKDKVDKFFNDLNKFVRNRQIIISDEDALEVIESNNSDVHKIYKELIETCNAEMSKAVIGQTMTTDNGSSRSQGEVHERVLEEISESDREFVENVVNDFIQKNLIPLGYPFTVNDRFKFISKEKRTYTQKLETIKTLKETGYLADAEDIKSYLDLPFDLETVSFTDTSVSNTFKKKVQ